MFNSSDFDKFRPSYSDKDLYIPYQNSDVELPKAIAEIKKIIDNPLDSFYEMFDVDYEEKHRHRNKYTAYLDGMYNNEFIPFVEKWWRRATGFCVASLIYGFAKIDPKVHEVEWRFHKDRWNPEFNINIGLKYGKTPYRDYKHFMFYQNIWGIKSWDVRLSLSFYSPKYAEKYEQTKYRGIYFKTPPKKDYLYDEDYSYLVPVYEEDTTKNNNE